jgi:hypothetical protein
MMARSLTVVGTALEKPQPVNLSSEGIAVRRSPREPARVGDRSPLGPLTAG